MDSKEFQVFFIVAPEITNVKPALRPRSAAIAFLDKPRINGITEYSRSTRLNQCLQKFHFWQLRRNAIAAGLQIVVHEMRFGIASVFCFYEYLSSQVFYPSLNKSDSRNRTLAFGSAGSSDESEE